MDGKKIKQKPVVSIKSRPDGEECYLPWYLIVAVPAGEAVVGAVAAGRPHVFTWPGDAQTPRTRARSRLTARGWGRPPLDTSTSTFPPRNYVPPLTHRLLVRGTAV